MTLFYSFLKNYSTSVSNILRGAIYYLYRPVWFVFEMARAWRHFLLGKGHPMKKLRKFTAAFQGHQGNEQGASHGGNRLCSIRPVIIFKSFKFNVYLWTLCFASYKKYPDPFSIPLITGWAGDYMNQEGYNRNWTQTDYKSTSCRDIHNRYLM